MATAQQYETRIRSLKWSGLQKLWLGIQNRQTPEWEPGKAFEYLVLRAFELDGATVKWPYQVPVPFLEDKSQFEQIDGSMRVNSLYCLLECKDEKDKVNVEPIAKLRNQVLRRPAGTVGMLFSTSGFTEPSILHCYFTATCAILLWYPQEVDDILTNRNPCQRCEEKFRFLVDFGQPERMESAEW